MDNVSSLIRKLYMEDWLRDEEFPEVPIYHGESEIRNLFVEYVGKTAYGYYGNKVYTRGLIEFSNYCRNGCYYYGIRRSNSHVQRHRLKKEDILTCCDEDYNLGFHTFVLQSGEDGYYVDEPLIEIIIDIKWWYPDCIITLSFGEKEKESYQYYYDADADRYLLRHETSNAQHYRCLHPKELTSERRKQCLKDLKAIGFQAGCGIVVGSSSQTLKHIVEDSYFMKELQPEMAGIGPSLPRRDTLSHNEPAGSFTLTLALLSIIRLILSDILLPATTASGTIDPQGREQGTSAGANAVMPSLSPIAVRKKYMLYNDKTCIGDEIAECRVCLSNRTERIGCELVTNRDDSIGKLEEKRICTIDIH